MTKHLIATGHSDHGAPYTVTAVMYRRCMTCNVSLDPPTITVPDGSPMAGTTTHGLCPVCKADWDRRLAEMTAAKGDA